MSMYGFNPFLYTMGQSKSWTGLPSSSNNTPQQSANDPFAFSSMPGFFNAPVAPTVTAPMPGGGAGGLNLSGGLPNATSTPMLPANLAAKPSTGTGSTMNSKAPATNSFSPADLSKMGVSSSVLTTMSQVNSMVSNAVSGLGPFVANIVNNPQNQPGAYNGTSAGGNVGDATYTGPAGTREAKAINWAQSEFSKKINEVDNNSYIIKNYANGSTDGKGGPEPWCADFVSKAYENTGGSPWGHQPGVAGIMSWGKSHNRYFSRGSKTPQPGDAIIFGGGSHVGIVVKVEGGKVYTIEGNTSGPKTSGQGSVNSRSYDLNSSRITGYVRPYGAM